MRSLGVDGPLVQARIPDVDEGHARLGWARLDAVLRRPQVDQELALTRRQDAIALVGGLALAEPHAGDDLGEPWVRLPDAHAPVPDGRLVRERLNVGIPHLGTTSLLV